MAGVVLTAFTDVQRLQRRFEGADCNTWLVDPQPTFARLQHEGASRVGRLGRHAAKGSDWLGMVEGVQCALV